MFLVSRHNMSCLLRALNIINLIYIKESHCQKSIIKAKRAKWNDNYSRICIDMIESVEYIKKKIHTYHNRLLNMFNKHELLANQHTVKAK